MTEELTDRFGTVPKPVQNLLDIAYLRVLAGKVFVTEIKGETGAIKFTVYEHADYDNEKIPELISRYAGALTLKVVAKPYFLYKFKKGYVSNAEEMLKKSRELLEDMHSLVKNLYTNAKL